ncbi:unnamed protein product [Arabidopsis halleri]
MCGLTVYTRPQKNKTSTINRMVNRVGNSTSSPKKICISFALHMYFTITYLPNSFLPCLRRSQELVVGFGEYRSGGGH